ncbi:MAG: rhomboid family intramembrane serine protease [Bdellovibrionota bacterium]
MTITLILVLNTVVYILWNYSNAVSHEFMEANFLVSWDAVLEGRYWTLITSVFSHSQLFHFILNMLVLSSFGKIMLQTLGTRRLLTFYLIAGAFSSLSHCLVSTYLMHDSSIPALGASGALTGIIMVFALIYPKEKLLLFGLVPLPAIFGALLFIGLDIWGLVAQAGGGGLPIGHGAHLGGSFAGLVYYFGFLRKRYKQNPSY